METAILPASAPLFDATLQICEYYAAPDSTSRASPEQAARLAGELWDSSKMWVSSAGPLARAPSLDRKYPGYTVYRFPFREPVFESEGTVPSRAAVLVRLPAGSDPAYDAFTLAYPTVRASSPTFLPNGTAAHLLTFSAPKAPPATESLKDTLWYQLGGASDPRIYLVKLEKNPACNLDVCLGYASGDLYPYRVTAAFALVKKL